MRLVFVGSAGTRKQNDCRKNDDAVLTRQAEYGLFKVQGSTVQQFKVQQFNSLRFNSSAMMTMTQN
jgi:hypothetical protein